MTINERNRITTQAGSEPEWDFEWDYTMGKLEDMPGWEHRVQVSGGTDGSEMTASGEKLHSDAGSYYLIRPQQGNPIRSLQGGYGVVEVVMFGVHNPGCQNLRITAHASDNKRVTLHQTGGKWRLLTAAVSGASAVLASFCDNTEYRVKIVFKNSTADLYINDVLAAADLDTSATLYGSCNSVMHQNGGSGSDYYAIIKSFRIKNGRI